MTIQLVNPESSNQSSSFVVSDDDVIDAVFVAREDFLIMVK